MQKSLIIFLCFLSILIFHIYRDIRGQKWTESPGLIIGILLFFISKNILVKIVGLFKIIAHVRQLIFIILISKGELLGNPI